MTTEIIAINTRGAPEASRPEPDRLLAGDPAQQAWNVYSNPSGRFFAGTWSSTRGAWRIRYTEDELCLMTAGRVRLTSASGRVAEFSAGDAFVVPGGFEGIWEVIEDCTKIYAICT